MKKVSKFQINPERIMKNEDLLKLRGGYLTYTTVFCFGGSPFGELGCVTDRINCWDSESAKQSCQLIYPETDQTNYTCGAYYEGCIDLCK
jgi:hypothetical protein